MLIASLSNNGGNRRILVVLLFAVAMLTVNLLLVRQNKSLKAYASKLDRSLELKLGTPLPDLLGRDIQGNKLSIDYGSDARRTILMVFSSGCGPCSENMKNWRALKNSCDASKYRLVGVSLTPSGTAEFVAYHKMEGIPIMSEVDAKSRVDYNLTLTPQTILIGPDGKTERVWSGVLSSGSTRAEVEHALNVRF